MFQRNQQWVCLTKVFPLYGYTGVLGGDPYNLIYLLDQPECFDTRQSVTHALHAVCGYPVEFSCARRVGNKNATIPRPTWINLKHFLDVEMIHHWKGPYTFLIYEDKPRSEIDGFQLKFCKKSLNVSNYASNSAVLGELGRHPLTFTCLVQVIKYWTRLSNGTKNDLLNSAFKMATIENNSWIQVIYFMLSHKSYRESWLYPPGVDNNFHIALRQRLRDQFIQHCNAIIHALKRFRF